MLVAGIYFLARMREIDLFAKLRNRKIERGGSRGWWGWRKQETYDSSDPPPEYPDSVYIPDEKSIPSQQQIGAFYTPVTTPQMATLATAATLTRSDSQRLEMGRETLLSNAAPVAILPAPQAV